MPQEIEHANNLAAEVSYPDAESQLGGRAMSVIESEAELPGQLEEARREAVAAFGNDEMYLEKLVRRACHVEVQGTRTASWSDCSVQRRNPKVGHRRPTSTHRPAARYAKRFGACGAPSGTPRRGSNS